ncbi:hypothetical protein BJ878DRAFT_536190 [Calycina marina]|uniref:Uncharacterized protein n=1 Tax=Calycina marina TaxID=1763456 RepID=A0A9P7YYA3_9HELO|nr:hypothetical protein BJ878DRAFT_536190 [Calycina marina]
MILLDSNTLRLTDFFLRDVPEYVILSHTWGEGEVSFQDFQDLKKIRERQDFKNLEQCCKKAKSDGLQWVINSMFRYYSEAAEICYAYVEDTDSSVARKHGSLVGIQLCVWFERGWSIPSMLIAPEIVEIYAKNWKEIGTNSSMVDAISNITSIDKSVILHTAHLDDFNVASRMHWVSKGLTMKEDEMYCLMGIFGVNVPMLCGEVSRAFQRLQEEGVMKLTEDYIFFQ